ncbi:aspartate racemase, partial [Burkholderia pseudomallei]
MKTIELIGGMSGESSAAYYRPINPRRTARLGGHRNARSIMATVCLDEIETRRHAGRRDEPGRLGQRAARQAEAGGADFILLCTHDAQGRARDRGRAVRAVRAHRRSAR